MKDSSAVLTPAIPNRYGIDIPSRVQSALGVDAIVTSKRTKKTISYKKIGFYIITVSFLLYTFVPMVSVLLFSFAGKWTHTMLPETWSVSAYTQVFSNSEFLSSLLRSCFVSLCVMMIDLTVVILALLGLKLTGSKKTEGIMEMVSIIPVALPGVILALGCILFYGEVFPALLGTPLLLILTEAAFALPFVFWTLQNAFNNSDIKRLYEASCILGAPLLKFICLILLPNLRKGILAASAMSFTICFNDFALAQLLVGAGFKTMPLFQMDFMKIDGHQTSAIAIISIMVTFVLATVLGTIKKDKTREARASVGNQHK